MRFLTGGYMLEQRKFMGARLPPKECTKKIPRGSFGTMKVPVCESFLGSAASESFTL